MTVKYFPMGDSSDWWVCSLANDWLSLAAISWASLTLQNNRHFHLFSLYSWSPDWCSDTEWFLVCLQNRPRISYLWLEHKLEDTAQKSIPPQRTWDFIPFRTPNKMKKNSTPLGTFTLYFFSKTLMAREELCQLLLALLHSWELPYKGTRFRFFWSDRLENAWGQHSAVCTASRDQTQVLPPYHLLTDKHTGVKHFSNKWIV